MALIIIKDSVVQDIYEWATFKNFDFSNEKNHRIEIGKLI